MKYQKSTDMLNVFGISFRWLFLVLAFASFSSAADPGHGAGSIGAGTFEAGNYVFPNNLSVGASGLFANAQSGFVGIGTTGPGAKNE